MKQRQRQFAAAALMLVLSLAAALGLAHPKSRAVQFTMMHAGQLEECIQANGAIPADIGIMAFHAWDGRHPMTEFVLSHRGGQISGCYYSPDDVPCAFRNEETVLSPQGRYWNWAGRKWYGRTQRLRQNWFYFEAQPAEKRGMRV